MDELQRLMRWVQGVADTVALVHFVDGARLVGAVAKCSHSLNAPNLRVAYCSSGDCETSTFLAVFIGN